MELSTIKLVTVIAPRGLKDVLADLFKSAGIRGYTYYYVYGAGERQLSGEEKDDVENVKFRILVPNLLAVKLLRVISEEFFEKEKVIAFAQDAEVVRRGKFDQESA